MGYGKVLAFECLHVVFVVRVHREEDFITGGNRLVQFFADIRNGVNRVIIAERAVSEIILCVDYDMFCLHKCFSFQIT